MGTVKLELKTPGELLDEIVRLRKALQPFSDAFYMSRRQFPNNHQLAFHDAADRIFYQDFEAAYVAISNGER